MKERSPSKKVRIKDIVEGKFFHGSREDLKESFLISPLGQKISRVNLVGSVIDKFSTENYSFLLLDDGSGSIRVKGFGEKVELLKNFEKGDLVQVIGKVKEFDGEIYVSCEIIRKVEPNFEIMRRLEVLKDIITQKRIVDDIKSICKLPEGEIINYAKEKYGLEEESVKYILEVLNRDREIDYKPIILKLIEELDEGNGVEVARIFELSNLPESEVEKTLDSLLNSGEIFEPTPGVLKRVNK